MRPTPGQVLSVLLAATFVGSFVLSLLHGAPKDLPDVALGSPLVIHALRAGTAAALIVAVTVIIVRLWKGDLPTKLSASGAEWSVAAHTDASEIQERLLIVERESKAAVETAVDVLTRRIEHLETDALALRPSGVEPLDEVVRREIQEGDARFHTALARWGAAINDAERTELQQAFVAWLQAHGWTVDALDSPVPGLPETVDVRARTVGHGLVAKLRANGDDVAPSVVEQLLHLRRV